MRTITLKPLEILFQLGVIMLSIWAIGWSTIFEQSSIHWGSGDFYIYYEAGHGHFIYGYIYKHYWAFILFGWMRFFSIQTAYFLWAGVQACAFLILTHYLFKVKYGWATILVALPAYKQLLQSSNCDLLLALVYILPVPAFLGILCKPHHLPFALIHSIVGRIRSRSQWRDRISDTDSTTDIHSNNLLHLEKEN